jgi:hypothetical protein
MILTLLKLCSCHAQEHGLCFIEFHAELSLSKRQVVLAVIALDEVVIFLAVAIKSTVLVINL